MKLLFAELAQLQPIKRAIIVSLDMSIYQLMVTTGRGDKLVWESAAQPLTARSIGALRKRLEHLAIGTITLRHDSAYDEMIGQPLRGANTLNVSLGAEN
jgi:hypothetical protein